MERVYNFSAGPATLPLEVLEISSNEMTNYHSSGMSVMEMSHRSKEYKKIFDEAKQDLIDLMEIPSTYEVLFLQGGASTQFAMIPMNIMGGSNKAVFVDTGAWSTKAIKEAKNFGEVKVIASSKETTYNYIPEIKSEDIDTDADFFYITSNNTIYGTEYKSLPKTEVPIVADMSSNILSKPINVSDYGIIFAGAQKNIGPSGVTVVIIRKDLLERSDGTLPTMFDYNTHVKADSMFNTPPTYSIYIAGLVFKWLKRKGGLSEIEKINKKKADLLYDYIDNSKLFSNPVAKKDCSAMNVTFILPSEELNAKFIEEAAKKGLKTLKGHRSVGGMRASIYNAMPYEGVKALVDFMKEFEETNQ